MPRKPYVPPPPREKRSRASKDAAPSYLSDGMPADEPPKKKGRAWGNAAKNCTSAFRGVTGKPGAVRRPLDRKRTFTVLLRQVGGAHQDAEQEDGVPRHLRDRGRRGARLRREMPRGPRQGRTRVIQHRFNVSVPRARVLEKASTLRDRSKR